MKRTWMWGLVLVVAAGILIGVWRNDVVAQQPAPVGLPIAVVDMVKIFNDNDQWKAINETLKTRSASSEHEAEGRKEKIAAKQKEAEAYQPNTPEWKKCNEELLELQAKAEVWLRHEKGEIEQLKAYWVQKNYADVTAAVAAIAKQQGIAMVLTQEELDKEGQDSNRMFAQIINRKVVYCDPRLDITPSVSKKFNDDFKLRGGADSLKTR
jgi:Skp family chaperone for outer membrane proteins